MSERVCCTVGFMSPAECVRRVQAATAEEAETMLNTLEAHARAEGRLAGLEEAAHGCESMVIGGRAWTEEQAIAADALFAAAAGIRRLAADGPKAPQDPKTPEIPAGKQG